MFNTAVIFHEPHGKTVNMFWGLENWSLELVGPDTFGKGWLKLVGWNRKPNIGGLVVSRTKQGLDWFVFCMQKKNPAWEVWFCETSTWETCFFHRDPGAHTAVGKNPSVVPVDQLFQDGYMAIGHHPETWMICVKIDISATSDSQSVHCWFELFFVGEEAMVFPTSIATGWVPWNYIVDCWGLFPIIWWFWHQHNYIKQYNWISLHRLTTILLPGFIRSHICGPLSLFSHI